jgi:ABC-2 type transport system permease protein
VAEPISDLSYRGYAGQKLSARSRWLVVARQGWAAVFKKRAFWTTSAFGAWYAVVLAAIVFFMQQASMASGSDRGLDAFFERLIWKEQFLTSFTFAQLMWLILTLIVGAGSIANDNRTNALLVYLSKPVSKFDYLFGKWMGVFVPLAVGMGAPTVFFYLYGLANFRDQGFVSQDPGLVFRLALMVLLAAAYHSTLILGVSSLFDQGRFAGGAYAAVTFVSGFFSQLMLGVFWSQGQGPGRGGVFSPEVLHYCSVDGLVVGMAKIVLRTDGGSQFGVQAASRQVPIPPAGMIFGLMAAAMALAWAVAAWRVRAVEVVK